MKKLVSISVILLWAAAVACSGQPPNPLIGKWKLSIPPGADSKTYAYCATSMVFTDTTQTLTYAGKPASEKVSYNAAQTAVYPTTVYVIGNAGHTTYNFSSKDKLVQDTAALCPYQRD